MKRQSVLLASIALLALGSAPAAADCAQDLAQFTAGGQATGSVQSGGISKDGTIAPLESQGGTSGGSASSGAAADPQAGSTASATGTTSSGATTGTSDMSASGGSGEISKDGGTMPLASSENGGDKSLATSDQDVASQQSGAGTAAEQADSGAAAASGSTGVAEGTTTQPGLSSGGDQQMAALERARAAQAAGDEQACMDALKEARGG